MTLWAILSTWKAQRKYPPLPTSAKTPIKIARRLTVLFPISWCLSSRAMRWTRRTCRLPVHQTSFSSFYLAYDPCPLSATTCAEVPPILEPLSYPTPRPPFRPPPRARCRFSQPSPAPPDAPPVHIRQYTNDIPSIHPPSPHPPRPRPAAIVPLTSLPSGRSTD